LPGSLIVCEFSGGHDLVILKPNADGTIGTDVGAVQRGMLGTTGLVDASDIVERVGPGDLYVAEYGRERITLLRPRPVDQIARQSRLVFNELGGAGSPTRTYTFTNGGSAPVTASGIRISG